jgi:hypothetical protein
MIGRLGARFRDPVAVSSIAVLDLLGLEPTKYLGMPPIPALPVSQTLLVAGSMLIPELCHPVIGDLPIWKDNQVIAQD